MFVKHYINKKTAQDVMNVATRSSELTLSELF